MRVFLLLTAALAFVLPARAQSPTPSSGTYAIVNVNVVPMDTERVLADHTVVVINGRITAVGPSSRVTPPSGATRIDGRGKYLMPGLAEMHGHIPPPNAPREFTEAVLFMYVANGITTVRGMLGYPGQLEFREQSSRGAIDAPNLYLAGPSFSNSTVRSVQQAIDRVRQQKGEGWDLLKIHPGLTVDQYDAMAKTAKEVGIRFGGHVPQDVGLTHAIEMGQETFDHVDGYVEHLGAFDKPVDEARLKDIVIRTKQAGASIVPTMALWEALMGYLPTATLTAYPELKYMPGDQVRQWTKLNDDRRNAATFKPDVARQTIQSRMRVLKALHDGGVPILLGTDAPQQFSVPGFSIHRELKRMVDAGIKVYDVLKSGTVNVGRYFESKDKFGTVATGQRADLILLEANPLTDVANVQKRAGVMVRGRWFPETAIQSRLEKIAAMYATGR